MESGSPLAACITCEPPPRAPSPPSLAFPSLPHHRSILTTTNTMGVDGKQHPPRARASAARTRSVPTRELRSIGMSQHQATTPPPPPTTTQAPTRAHHIPHRHEPTPWHHRRRPLSSDTSRMVGITRVYTLRPYLARSLAHSALSAALRSAALAPISRYKHRPIFEFAVFIWLRCFLDALDGSIARACHNGTPFGPDLDTLLDCVPAACCLYFAWCKSGTVVLRLFHSCCMVGLRLFHSCSTVVPRLLHGYSTGVPQLFYGCSAVIFYGCSTVFHGCATVVLSHHLSGSDPRKGHFKGTGKGPRWGRFRRGRECQHNLGNRQRKTLLVRQS